MLNKQNLLEVKAQERKHVITFSEYADLIKKWDPARPQNIPPTDKAKLFVRCTKHMKSTDPPIETNIKAYLRAATGLDCCGNASKSKKLKTRTYSPATIQKMSQSAIIFQATRPRAVDRRDSIEYDRWRAAVQKEGKWACCITGVRPKSLTAHHLFSLMTFPSIGYNSLNGVTLDANLHNIFHKIYGYKQPVNITCFIMFLEDLQADASFRDKVLKYAEPKSPDSAPLEPLSTTQTETTETGDSLNPSMDSYDEISSPVVEDTTTGSETKAFDVTTINKLHERMVQLKTVLESALSDDEKRQNALVNERVLNSSSFVRKPDTLKT